jgi:hypothetical protein
LNTLAIRVLFIAAATADAAASAAAAAAAAALTRIAHTLATAVFAAANAITGSGCDSGQDRSGKRRRVVAR